MDGIITMVTCTWSSILISTALYLDFHRVVNGICTGVEIGVPATFDIVVTLQECTVDLAAGPLEYVLLTVLLYIYLRGGGSQP